MVERKTTTEAQLREWIAAGQTHKEIAERLGVSRGALANACSILGIESTRGRRPLTGCATTYYAGIVQGKTLWQIANENKVTRQCVFGTLKRAGLPTSAREYLQRTAAAELAVGPDTGSAITRPAIAA